MVDMSTEASAYTLDVNGGGMTEPDIYGGNTRVRIVSLGHWFNTRVFIDGKECDNVRDISWAMDSDSGVATATVTFEFVELDTTTVNEVIVAQPLKHTCCPVHGADADVQAAAPHR